MTLPTPGVKLIKQFEGCILHAYLDPRTGGEPITIGWGSTKKLDGSEWRLGDTITQQEADQLLISQLNRDYLPPLQKIPCWDDLNQNQQGAILSFAYNLGANFYNRAGFTTISKLLKNPDLWYDHIFVKNTFGLYCNPGTKVEQGLIRRRTAEAKLWLLPAVQSPASVSAT